MAVNAAVMLVLLLFPALAFVTEGLFTQSNEAMTSLNREAKVANRVHAIRFGSRNRLTRAIIPAGENYQSHEIGLIVCSIGASHIDSSLNDFCS